MPDRIAIKRLTASDCTLFEAVFRRINAGNQKSINLNADVLTGQLYPGLSVAAALTDNEIALPMAIFGPGGKPAHTLSRKIIKNPSYKNWRLNGEFIFGPPGDHARYDGIQPGDLAVLAFKGVTVPTGLDMIVVSQANPADTALHSALSGLFPGNNRSMIGVTPAQIADAASAASAPEGHPIFLASADPEIAAALEDAAQGGMEGTGKLLRNRGARKITAADLTKAKVRAEITGQEGEGIVHAYLSSRKAKGEIADFKWVSAENAIAPFDFEVTERDGSRTLIDAKTTNGPFENVIHISLAEIIEAAGAIPYRIYRVSDLTEDGGTLRISDTIAVLAQRLKTTHESTMPPGVRVDGYSISPSALRWGQPEYVERPDDEAG